MLFPPSPGETLEGTEGYKVFRQNDGVIAKHWKHRSSTPHFTSYMLRYGSAWGDCKQWLLPSDRRISEDMGSISAQMRGHGEAIRVCIGSLVEVNGGRMRVKGPGLLQHDDQDLPVEMVGITWKGFAL